MVVADAGGWLAYLPDTGELIELWAAAAVLHLALERGLTLHTRDSSLLLTAADELLRFGHPARVLISMAGTASLRLSGVLLGKGYLYATGLLLPDLTARRLYGVPSPADVDPVTLAIAEADALRSWRGLIVDAGLSPRASLGATAAGIVPRAWRRAAAACQTQLPELWALPRSAYYGGRVQCYKPGWKGQAAEYDLTSAYGWAMACLPSPDHKIYDYHARGRPWLPIQPAWIDATVEVSGTPGPLPVRGADGALSWPESGRHRSWWTRIDLEQSGVNIIETHALLAGRWTDALQRPVSAWLDRRAGSGDPAERSLLRALTVALAGKLCQRPLTWAIWQDAGGLPPPGALALGHDSALMAVPVTPQRLPWSSPTTGSYVTAQVRARVLPELRRPDAIYTDTDSVHLPADAAPPRNVGSGPGQWALKAKGAAMYRGVRQYHIGVKRVGVCG